MGSNADAHRVVIVGAGVIGCAAARELAPDHEVIVVEKDQIASNASGRASGMVTFSAQRSVLPEDARHSLEFFHSYEGTEQYEFTERPGIELVPEGNADTAKKRAEGAQEADFPIEYLDVEAIEEMYPGVFDLSDYVGGLKYGDTGWLDPYTLTMSLKEDAENDGAEFRTGVVVEAVQIRDGEIVGVATEEGDIEADSVVVAAGWRTRELLDEHVQLPVRAFRYQTVNLEPNEPIEDEDFPIGWDPVTEFYWRPEHNGEFHVGGGEYLVEDPGGIRETVNEEFKMKVATEIPDRFQGFSDAEFVSEDTCPSGDSATPDSLPIIDSPDEVPDGLVVATGFHGYGIMEAPTGATAVRSLVADEEAPFSLEPYELARFDDRSTDFGLVSLSEKREKHY